MGRYDHLVYNYREQKVHCNNCGDSYIINLPAPIDMMVAILAAFKKSHRKCKPKPSDKVTPIKKGSLPV